MTLPRIVEECPHRVVNPSNIGTTKEFPAPLAVCELIERITGVADHHLAAVQLDACTACCELFLPTERDWNAVIPSLVSKICHQVIQLRGVEGCTLEQAVALKQRAEEAIPLLLPEESDLVSQPLAMPIFDRVTVDQIADLIPPPNLAKTVRRLQWSVGVTTHQRRVPTLQPTLDAVVTAGWEDYRIFTDGPLDHAMLETNSKLSGRPQWTCRDRACGAWSNYFLSLAELYHRSPTADAFLLLQDDALLARLPSLRGYIDSVISGLSTEAMLSLYSCSDDTQTSPGWVAHQGPWRYGALAFVFLPDAIHRFVTDQEIWRHHLGPSHSAQTGVDPLIGHWAARHQIEIWHPTPSLVQHIGDVSTIWEDSRAIGLRRAAQFLETAFVSAS